MAGTTMAPCTGANCTTAAPATTAGAAANAADGIFSARTVAAVFVVSAGVSYSLL